MSTPTPFVPHQFHDIALEIVNQSTDEAHVRSAINRLYYAAYWLARAKTGIPLSKPKRGSHAEVIHRLRVRGFRTEADQLHGLSELREVADYEHIPRQEVFRDWSHNWTKAKAFATFLMGRL